MKHFYLLIIGVISSIHSIGQTRNYWLSKDLPVQIKSIKYDKAIIIEIKPNKKNKELVVTRSKILDTTIIIFRKELSKAQVDTLEKFIFASKEASPKSPANLASSHLGVIYYLNNKIVAFFTSHFEDNFYKLTVVDQKIEGCKNCGWYFTMTYNQENRKRINYLFTTSKY